MRKSKLFQVRGDDIVIPKRTMDIYKQPSGCMDIMDEDKRLFCEELAQHHPEVYDLVKRVITFASSIMMDIEQDILLELCFSPAMDYLDHYQILDRDEAYKTLVKETFKRLPLVFHYSVYAATSGERMEPSKMHWDPIESGLREWVLKYNINKLFITYNQITSKLNNEKLSFMVAPRIFNDKEMGWLCQSSRCVSKTVLTPCLSDADNIGATQYCQDNIEALDVLSMSHPRIEVIARKMAEHIGFDIQFNHVPLIDMVLADAITNYSIDSPKFGVKQAYNEFINSILNGVSRLLDFHVVASSTGETWKPFQEAYQVFAQRHGKQAIEISTTEDRSHVLKEDAVYAIIPFVLERKDMVTLSMPAPGFNVVLNGNSVFRENDNEHSNCG